jgi:hypothetical protein
MRLVVSLLCFALHCIAFYRKLPSSPLPLCLASSFVARPKNPTLPPIAFHYSSPRRSSSIGVQCAVPREVNRFFRSDIPQKHPLLKSLPRRRSPRIFFEKIAELFYLVNNFVMTLRGSSVLEILIRTHIQI